MNFGVPVFMYCSIAILGRTPDTEDEEKLEL